MRISSNYGLKLMEGTDNVKRQDFVDNFSKIDTEMRAIENEAYPIVEATGTNAYIGANVRIQSLKKGTKLTLFVGTNATGNCSLNLNSYGSKNIKDSNGNIVTNIKANIPYNLCYNGTDFILQGKGGGGNLIPKYLLAGYYGEGDNGRVDGAMANNGAVTSTLTAGTSYTIPAGYHNGSGKITANNLASQTNATATAPQILSGQTAYVNGNKITGNMPNLSSNSSISYENGNSTKVIVGDQAFGPITNTDGTNRVLIRYNNTNGFVTGNTLVGVSTSNMASQLGITSDKIVAGNTICGVNGTATIYSMGGVKKTVASSQTEPFKQNGGNAYWYGYTYINIPSNPSIIIVKATSGSQTFFTALFIDEGNIELTKGDGYKLGASIESYAGGQLKVECHTQVSGSAGKVANVEAIIYS